MTSTPKTDEKVDQKEKGYVPPFKGTEEFKYISLDTEGEALKQLLAEKNISNPTSIMAPEIQRIRYIRGYETFKDPKKVSQEKYKAMVDWRQENKVDDALLSKPKVWKLYNKVFFSYVYGRDKKGHPVAYERLGKLEPENILEIGDENIIECTIRFLEELNKIMTDISQSRERPCIKHVHVIDLEGFGWKHMKSKFRGIIKKIMELSDKYYPETLEKLFILNSSMLFRTLWAVLSPFVHPLTRARIVMLGYDKNTNLKALSEFIDVNQIPKFLGGRNEEPLRGICEIEFDDIDYSTEPATWKSSSRDLRALYHFRVSDKTRESLEANSDNRMLN